MKVLHVITDLEQGGAEALLHRVVMATLGEIEHAVVSLHGDRVYGPRLRAAGVAVDMLAMPRGRPTPKGARQLRRRIDEVRPDVIQTWMYHSDLLGAVVAATGGIPPVIWGVHSIDVGPFRRTWKTRLVRRACAAMSHFVPARIVCVAHSAAHFHARLGYARSKMVVIPGGVDLDVFRPDPESRRQLRAEWGLADDVVAFGFVARWDPLKDHANLIAALRLVAQREPNCRCVLTGGGITIENGPLMELLSAAGVTDRVVLLGPRSDIPRVMNAIDIHVLPSRSEAGPIAPQEAMACGTPCVVTDVGDAAILVGDTGWVAPPRNASGLAEAMETAIRQIRSSLRPELQRRSRQRIEGFYSVRAMAESYKSVWSNPRGPLPALTPKL